MQVVNDNHTRRRAPAYAAAGSDVTDGGRACALVDDVGEVLAQLAAGLLINAERGDHTGPQLRRRL